VSLVPVRAAHCIIAQHSKSGSPPTLLSLRVEVGAGYEHILVRFLLNQEAKRGSRTLIPRRVG